MFCVRQLFEWFAGRLTTRAGRAKTPTCFIDRNETSKGRAASAALPGE
jgi:hypothetical protein